MVSKTSHPVRRILWWIGIFILILIMAVVLIVRSARNTGITSTLETPRIELASQVDTAGFARAAPEGQLVFPKDFGAHPDYQTEWWYYTGSLSDPSGRRFGYQLTFFRRALLAPAGLTRRQSNWDAGQVYLAHMALTDVKNRQHVSFERLARGAAGVAGASSVPFEVWLDDWEVQEVEKGVFQLRAAAMLESGDDIRLSLQLKDEKGLVLHGLNGYNQNGPDPGNASYYYSRTRMETAGQIELGGQLNQVEGYSWMDHEFSTRALAADQVGWDWFSIQLDDQTELMVYQIRRKDGSIDPFSGGTWIAIDASTSALAREDFEIKVSAYWTSPVSGGVYPSQWEIIVPGLDMTLQLSSLVPDQEMNLTYRYWEGAVQAQGQRAGLPVSGYGYVELTGYAGPMTGDF